MKNPPDLVKRVFDCVLILRQFPMAKVEWQDFKGFKCFNSSANYPNSVKMMSDTQFLAKLMQFPKERINDETCELLQPYFAAPDFNPEDASKASNAAVGLCNWAEAMVTYHEVAKVVDPKIMMPRRRGRARCGKQGEESRRGRLGGGAGQTRRYAGQV